ncbi:MAG: GntR family transcriptional regulator [Candidatus Fermentibacteraceae bacterium]|nr:GntR family transcriptional regulator [Candidatus Fermentibacteraceae bacterium]
MYRIDSRSAIPVYEQLKRQIRLCIASGRLTENEKLPSIRELASTLRINPNTVAKAYYHLETDGFVTSRKGLGVFVSAGRKNLQSDRETIFSDLTDEFISRLTELGFASEEIVKGLSDRLRGEIEHDQIK